MPTLVITQQHLNACLGSNYDTEELDKLLFDFGLELDEVESNEEGEVVYKIDVPANRHDLLSAEGLAQALLIFQGKANIPKFQVISGTSDYYITVDPKNLSIRPYVFGAVLKGITFTPGSFASFINFQEKLHSNICRNRSIVAIGTHDLDTIKPPFTYTGDLCTDIEFIPLTETSKSFRADKLLEHYMSHKQLKKYVPLLKDSKYYPVIKDSNGVICSLPPIINSNHSRISLTTKNIFIDVTATNKQRGEVVLQQLVAAFSMYTTPQYQIHTIETRVLDKCGIVIPKEYGFSEMQMVVSLDYLRRVSGINDLQTDLACKLFNRMMLNSKVTSDNQINISVPINRSDIHSRCDVAEDLCIAYGYNNINKKFYPSGNIQSVSLVKNNLRKLLSLCNYHEVIMPILTASKYESGISSTSPVTLLNSNVPGIDIVRTSLVTGLLKALSGAKSYPLPIRIFEIGDICIKNADSDVEVVNVTKLAVAVTDSQTAGFEEVHGVLECIMNSLGYASRYQFDEFKMLNKPVPFYLTKMFDLKEVALPCFLNKRCVEVVNDLGVGIGIMGVVHPEFLKKFDISTPTSLFEITLFK